MPGATANGSFAYIPISSVIEQAMSTVAVIAPANDIPVPGVERMPGLTTTMYAIVKKVVMPPARSPYLEAGEGEDTARNIVLRPWMLFTRDNALAAR